ncbi:MAG: tetratricopeptide repeat protein, partial [Candidatus Saccharibacteria bacterium]|nr:tetratricopeptide repeat protein [Pseudorhodobacter sp.]
MNDVPVTFGGRKSTALLAYLCRSRAHTAPRETLTGLLWGDSQEEQARASLRQTLSAIRRGLGPAANGVIGSDMQSVRLEIASLDVDAAQFESLAKSKITSEIKQATDLWRGEFLEGLGPISPEFDRWADAERAVLRSSRAATMLQLVDLLFQDGRMDDAIATALRLLAHDPLQEHVHRRVMRAYMAQRRHDAALRQFATLTTLLADELGVAPESATADLEREARQHRKQSPASTAAQQDSVQPLEHREGIATPPAIVAPAKPSIAVLAFRSITEDAVALPFAEGGAGEITVNLSRDRGLLVVARQSSSRFSLSDASPSDIGQALGVRFLMSGTVQVANGRVRVTVHLVRCDNGAEVWGDTFDRSLANLFEVQSEIARHVMVTTVGRIAAEEPWPVAERATASFEVYQLLHRGLQGLDSHTASGMRDAVETLTRAVALAPRDGRAHGLLAMAMIYDRWYFDLDATVANVIPIADKALTLDPRDSRAHCALGVAYLVGRDHSRAAHHFEAGLAANPNDDLLLVEYGRFLMYVDRPEDGLRRVREAMRLNPFHPVWYWNIVGRCFHLLDRPAEALDAFRRIPAPAFYHL